MMDIAELGLAIRSDGVVVATKRLKDFDRQSSSTEVMAGKLTRALNRLAVVAGTVMVGALGTQSLRAFASYEQGLRNVAAVSGATADELIKLDRAALQAAASTRFNPSQTTSALYSLASAGQSASEQIASLRPVLDLAEAAQADLGQTTELMTSSLAQFNLSASQSTRVADVFTASIGASALNVNRLQVAFRNAGPTASALNQTLEGTTAGLAVLTSAFGNGERAGTGFRAVLNELPAQAASLKVKLYEANGEMRPFVDILADLEAGGLTAASAVRIFGAEAGPSLAAFLTKGSAGLAEMESKLVSTGQAAAVASEQLDTLQGDFDNLASAISVALVEVGRSHSQFARPAIQTITNLIRVWSGYGDTLGDAQESTERLAGALERAAFYAGAFAAAIAARAAVALGVTFTVAVIGAIQQLIALEIALGATSTMAAVSSVAVKGLTLSLRLLRTALITTGIGALIVGAGELAYRFTQLVEKTGSFGAALKALGTASSGLAPAMNSIWKKIEYGFLTMVARLQKGWVDFLHMVGDSVLKVPGLEDLGVEIKGHAMMAASGFYELQAAAGKAADEAAQYKKEAEGLFAALNPESRMDGIGEGASFSELAAFSKKGGKGGGGGGGSGLGLGGATDEAVNKYAELVRGAKEFVSAQGLEARALGMTEEAANSLRFTQDLLNQAANDNIKLTPEQTAELGRLGAAMAAAEAQTNRLTEAYNFGKSTLNSFFSDLKSNLAKGESLWNSFGSAVGGVLDNIANRALKMASDGIWDMVFGAVAGAFGGGGGGLNFTPGTGNLFASGGYTGNGPTDQMAGVVHGQEYVLNANATRQIGRANLDAMNAGRMPANNNMPASANSNAPVVQIIDQRGSGSIKRETTTGPNGEKQLRLIIRDEVTEAHRRGALGF